MSDTLNAIKKIMMIITVIVTALIVILMERSFISKEKSKIALMKEQWGFLTAAYIAVSDCIDTRLYPVNSGTYADQQCDDVLSVLYGWRCFGCELRH